MNAIHISPATVLDAYALAKVLRPADLDELAAASGRDPLEVLLEGIATSAECWAAWIDGEILAIWGVVPAQDCSALGPQVGCGWLLTGACITRHKAAFWRACRAELTRLLERWDVLVNWIDCRHETALRWGARLGFRFDAPAPFGIEGLPFQRFFVSKEDLCARPL